jgi:hypothetical protein
VATGILLSMTVYRKDSELIKTHLENKRLINKRELGAESLNIKYFRNVDTILPKAHSELSAIRLERVKQRKLKYVFLKAFMHAVFLSILFIIAYSSRDVNNYRYLLSLNTLFTNSTNPFYSIHNVILNCVYFKNDYHKLNIDFLI